MIDYSPHLFKMKIDLLWTEEMSDLRGQLKMLEEKNTSYMQKNMDLEEVSHCIREFNISVKNI